MSCQKSSMPFLSAIKNLVFCVMLVSLGVTLVFHFSHHHLVCLVPLNLYTVIVDFPVVIVSDFKYYLVIFDDFVHYLWMLPLRLKSVTFDTLTSFIAFVSTQFVVTIKALQYNNGREWRTTSPRRRGYNPLTRSTLV
jgi:hypothetical protein